MIHLDRLLFPTDGSECAERARRHAFHLADRFDAAVHVLHVEEREAALDEEIDIREADVLADLHLPLAPEEPPRAEPQVCERTIAHSSAAEGILTYALERDMDLVVLGTHGRRGVRRFVLGSVAEEVVRRAPCPVVTIGRGGKAPEAMANGRLLAPVDFSDHQGVLLAHARELARTNGMAMTILHVLDTDAPLPYRDLHADPDVLIDRIWNGLEVCAGRLRDHGVEVDVKVEKGHPAREILDATEALGADLLTIATHGRTGLDRMLMGSVAEKVVRQAPCPVFTVKALGTSLVRDDEKSKYECAPEPPAEDEEAPS